MAASPPTDAPLHLRLGDDVYPLGRPRAVIGRSRSCEIRLKEDTVSRLHAAFVWRGPNLVLEDLGSSNGTFVNGQRITGPQVVTANDAIRFGSLRATIEAVHGSEPQAVPFPTPDRVADYTIGVIVGTPAGVFHRLLAVAVDVVLFAVGSAIPFAPLLGAFIAERHLLAPEVVAPSLNTKAVIAGGCAALWVLYSWYYVIHGWARRGGTPGLRLCGLRLQDWRQTIPIGYPRALLRVVALGVTAATFGLGFLVAAFRRDRRTLHDLLAGTSVVRRARPLGVAGTTA
ncbi:MAG: FHA domain-containing protein [Acidobacteriota bacterium]